MISNHYQEEYDNAKGRLKFRVKNDFYDEIQRRYAPSMQKNDDVDIWNQINRKLTTQQQDDLAYLESQYKEYIEDLIKNPVVRLPRVLGTEHVVPIIVNSFLKDKDVQGKPVTVISRAMKSSAYNLLAIKRLFHEIKNLGASSVILIGAGFSIRQMFLYASERTGIDLILKNDPAD